MFKNRFDAGKRLAEMLANYREKEDVLMLAIPRGGVQVGYAIVKELSCPLDVVISKKIPYPGQQELAIGAVCNDVVSLDSELIKEHDIDKNYVEKEIKKLKGAIFKRYTALTGHNKFPDISKKTVIVVDDGIATGHTLMAAIKFVRSQKTTRLIAAIPVGPKENIEVIEKMVDELVVLENPVFFMAVGEFYRDFEQLSDEDVARYLKK